MPSFETTDLACAAALKAAGHRLIGITGEGWKKSFVFAMDNSIQGDRMSFLHDDLRVRAKTLTEAMKDLKAMVQT